MQNLIKLFLKQLKKTVILKDADNTDNADDGN